MPGLIVPQLGSTIGVGLGVFILRQHFMNFPRELCDAAQEHRHQRLEVRLFLHCVHFDEPDDAFLFDPIFRKRLLQEIDLLKPEQKKVITMLLANTITAAQRMWGEFASKSSSE